MISLLALLLASPMPEPLQVWKDELLCWDSGYCQKRVVVLGTWDPTPDKSTWDWAHDLTR